MKKITLLVCIVLAFALTGCRGRRQAAEQISIRASTIQMPNQQMGQGLKMLEENIKKELGDKVDFKGYDSAQLYSSAAEIEAVSRGEIQMAFPIGGAMETISNKIQIVKLPWLFPNITTAYNVLENGETGKQIFAPVEEKDMRVLGFFTSGTASITNSRNPLRVPADFVGLKLRAPGKMETMTINALGANTIVTPSEEMYTAIQQGVLDGLSLPSMAFVQRRLYEVQKYVTNSDNLAMQIGYLIVNKTWYDGLPADIRAGIDRAVKVTIDKLREEAVGADIDMYRQMQDAGCEVYNLSDADKELWKQTAESVIKAMEAELGADLIALAKKEAGSM
jgi:C4-dicarboxylate-binding protein DctP